ncbi:hypothetical protein FJQ98_16360 [Lysinibacillus agricola]|uniref:Uncharacterized protein n=1 Tax=Lysinibacillus agricola TaxID=2590012 RepID=A0ABX7APH2_9BACI|nr:MULTISPECIES: hypothetical protein [Lysinibacillus]KOS61495.1 hypothetical protein AN161_18055 [Lysinibacillus sp. FJAT-14222]QQP10818.1 hypothetical protein FJQ98_16360 [Lysinibacillus agricola]
MNKESTLMMMEAERDQAELRVLAQINSLRNTLNNLENVIKNGEAISESQGLQGNGDYLDIYLTKLITYNKVIEQVKNIK